MSSDGCIPSGTQTWQWKIHHRWFAHAINGHFRILNWRYLAYIKPMWGLCPHKIWPYMVQYLHFRILRFPLNLLRDFPANHVWYHRVIASLQQWQMAAPIERLRQHFGRITSNHQVSMLKWDLHLSLTSLWVNVMTCQIDENGMGTILNKHH